MHYSGSDPIKKAKKKIKEADLWNSPKLKRDLNRAIGQVRILGSASWKESNNEKYKTR